MVGPSTHADQHVLVVPEAQIAQIARKVGSEPRERGPASLRPYDERSLRTWGDERLDPHSPPSTVSRPERQVGACGGIDPDRGGRALDTASPDHSARSESVLRQQRVEHAPRLLLGDSAHQWVTGGGAGHGIERVPGVDDLPLGRPAHGLVGRSVQRPPGSAMRRPPQRSARSAWAVRPRHGGRSPAAQARGGGIDG
jgi:hypothetical protein